jgi:Tfp pilus assembly protein PilX
MQRRTTSRPARQRGIVMLFGLIALIIMMIGGVALIRSVGSSMVAAGNIAFKRDMANQGERVFATVLAEMQTGNLSTAVQRQNHRVASNYSASMLATNAQGIPLALLTNDAGFAAVGAVANDLSVPAQKVTIRYVVDRLCATTGLDAVLGSSGCTLSEDMVPKGGSSNPWESPAEGSAGNAGAVPPQVVYRLSVRVTGPRNTQSFFQSTFSL